MFRLFCRHALHPAWMRRHAAIVFSTRPPTKSLSVICSRRRLANGRLCAVENRSHLRRARRPMAPLGRMPPPGRGEGCRGELQTVKSGYAPVTFFKSQIKFTKFLMNYSREAIMALSASIERSLGGNKPACLSLHESRRRFGRGKLRSHHTDADSVGQ